MTRLPIGGFGICAACVVLAVAACAGRGSGGNASRPLPPISETEENIKLMLSYDENSDGTVTRDELEAGLRRQYAAADLNHDGKIDIREMQAENDRRFRAFGTAASPLIDWNQDGMIDFTELPNNGTNPAMEFTRTFPTPATAEIAVIP